MNPLTRRDESANDLRHLLTNPAPREDCPKTLVSPASATRKSFDKELIEEITALEHLVEGAVNKVESVIETVLGNVASAHDETLPDSGNIIGFLHILLKTELECSQLNEEDEAEQVRILENYRKISTKSEAQSYVKYMRDKIEATKRRAE
jgi:phospholipase C